MRRITCAALVVGCVLFFGCTAEAFTVTLNPGDGTSLLESVAKDGSFSNTTDLDSTNPTSLPENGTLARTIHE